MLEVVCSGSSEHIYGVRTSMMYEEAGRRIAPDGFALMKLAVQIRVFYTATTAELVNQVLHLFDGVFAIRMYSYVPQLLLYELQVYIQ